MGVTPSAAQMVMFVTIPALRADHVKVFCDVISRAHVPPSAFALADAMQVVETSRLVLQARTQAHAGQDYSTAGLDEPYFAARP
jgi:hypothetical protein